MCLYFFITLLFFCTLLTFTRRIHLFIKSILIVFCVISLLIVFKFFDIDIYTRGEQAGWYTQTPWKHLILFFSMCLGMVTNYFFDFLQERIKAKTSGGKAKLPILMWEKLALGGVVSGLVFGYFWGEHSNEAIEFTVVFASYQNGFFWQTFLEKMRPSASS